MKKVTVSFYTDCKSGLSGRPLTFDELRAWIHRRIEGDPGSLEVFESDAPAEATVSTITMRSYPSDEQEFIDWLDAGVIHESIVDALAKEGLPNTFDNCKRIWLDVLENLRELVDISAESLSYDIRNP